MNLQDTVELRRNSWLWRQARNWLVGVLPPIVWLVRYVARFGIHLGRPPQWAAHFDQAHYLASVHAFAHGEFAPTQHWYPLAYSLIAAPFVWVLPNEPFFLPDLLSYVATVLIFARVMRRVGVSAGAATLLMLLGDMVDGRIARLWTVPWTTSLSAPLIWGLIGQALAILDMPADRAKPGFLTMLSLGLLAGLLPLVRPTDAVMGLLAILFTIFMLWRQGRLRPASLGWILAGWMAAALPYGLLYLFIYGPHQTEYMRDAAQQGFAFADLPWKAYEVVVTAAPWFPNSPSLIEVMPWIVSGIAGLGMVFKYGSDRARTALALIALLAIPYCAIFLAYTDLQPPGLWTFSNAHYFKWLFPLLSVGSWLWLRNLRTWHGTRRAIFALLIVLLPTTIRPLPVRAAQGTPARMLMFRGATDRVWDEAYFSHATLTDAQGSMNNVGRFHQAPDQFGERAIAVSRLFIGQAERNDPGERPSDRVKERPYARYATGLSIGLPCWLRRQSACQLPRPLSS